MKLSVNGKQVDLAIDNQPDMPLLWALRDLAGIKGPKYGCGVSACGACTVLIDGMAVRSCSVAAADVSGDVITIDGLAEGDQLHPVQAAWLALDVAQCGYCQGGQIMSAVALLLQNPRPTDQDIDLAMDGNLCRCGTYPKIKAAILAAADTLNSKAGLEIET